LLRGADDVVKPWALSEIPTIEPRNVITSTQTADTAGDRGSDVLWHLAKETGEEALEMAIEYEMEKE
jgi:hypothetical protein